MEADRTGTASGVPVPPPEVVRWRSVRPRPEALSACAAPSVTMEFDPFGEVNACCANLFHPLGNVRTSSLDEIWRGPRAQALRDALAAGDLSRGCGVCRHRLAYGHGDLARDYYDTFVDPVTGRAEGDAADDGPWPSILTFSLHNTCNLACVMCGADRSSRIRTQRDGLEPLPHVYGDEFFAQLRPYLARCRWVDFTGGEPFLVREHQRVWRLLAEVNPSARCSVTTNGTVWNDRVDELLDLFDTDVCVSVDGTTPHTLETVRVGTEFDVVAANLERFRRYTSARGTELRISFSLVRQNWFELGRMLRWGEERGIPVKVQTVLEPEFGVQAMPTEDLQLVVRALEAEDRHLRPALDRNLAVWDGELHRLRRELDRRRAAGPLLLWCHQPPTDGAAAHVGEVARAATGPRRSEFLAEVPEVLRAVPDAVRADPVGATRAELAAWVPGGTVAELELDTELRVRRGDLSTALTMLPDLAPTLPGRTFEELLDDLAVAAGAALSVLEEFPDDVRVIHLLWLSRDQRDKVGLVVRTALVPEPAGVRLFVVADDALFRSPTDGSVPVRLSRSS